MTSPLRILMLEDSVQDAELIQELLKAELKSRSAVPTVRKIK